MNLGTSHYTAPWVLLAEQAVELALGRFPRIIGLREGRVLFDCPAAAVTPAMLAELYAGDDEAAACSI